MNFVSQIIKHPFKYYFRGASLGFGLTVVSNYGVGLLTDKPPICPINDPQIFAMMTLWKGMYFGALFPIIPVMGISRPKEYFVVGGYF